MPGRPGAVTEPPATLRLAVATGVPGQIMEQLQLALTVTGRDKELRLAHDVPDRISAAALYRLNGL